MFNVKYALAAVLVSSAGMAFAADHTVTQKDKQFSQSEITVKAGDTITFSNDDAIAHNLYSKSSGNEFEIPKQDPGSKNPITFKTPGEAKVQCAIHPKMKLVVKVQ
ncbi:MAG: cupredoxin domain-containing protein [Alphaproteobacteria bacterium]|nr:cupredoxin domain-containing protein [Alphaproteobacteria bacterium]